MNQPFEPEPGSQNFEPPGAPPQFGQQQPGYGQPMPAYGGPMMQYPEGSQSTTVLVLGICSLVVCGLLGPVAWKMGNDEISAIDSGRRDPTKRDQANIGRILGMVSTGLMAIGLLFFLVFIVFGVFAAAASPVA